MLVVQWGWVLIYISMFGFSDAVVGVLTEDAWRLVYYAVVGVVGLVLTTGSP